MEGWEKCPMAANMVSVPATQSMTPLSDSHAWTPYLEKKWTIQAGLRPWGGQGEEEVSQVSTIPILKAI
jgi:hypothetical protein